MLMYLNTHSYYSLRYGTMSIEDLVNEAIRNGISAFALTDINNTTGMMDFIRLCREKKICPVAGAEIRDHHNRLLYVAIARNAEGFREINEFITGHNETGEDFPDDPGDFSHVYIIYPFGRAGQRILRDNEYIGIAPGEINRLVLSPQKAEKMVISRPVTFCRPTDYMLHRHLRAVDNNTLLSKLNGHDVAGENEMLMPAAQLVQPYAQYKMIIRNTETILSSCSCDIDLHSVKNKKTFTGSRYDDRCLLRKLAYDGLAYRYGHGNEIAARRVDHELQIIDTMNFSSYFLITWDIIRYSMSRGFYHVGRGSGANSVVAYCLRITDVDPIELDLYFERFINPKRTSPPDFDIDYSWKDRDEVFDYIFKRYGKKHTALLGTMSTFRGSSIFRELGKVYGLPKEEIDALVDNPERADCSQSVISRIMKIGALLSDFPNQRSIHAGGVLVSDDPLTYYTALDYPPKKMFVTQWDMYVAEEIGYEKIDILSQRGIGHINDCADIVRKNRGISVDVHDVKRFKQDDKVRECLRNGDAIGCFYIESPAMRGLLTKLRCDNYISLVAASSIIRPGVARSGMMKEYIRRFHHPENIPYLHPLMKEHLGETYGVMVYQEDVIKIGHFFAGLDFADADILRRAMSGKFRSLKEFDRIKEKFFSNCRERGYASSLTAEVWRQIESFAGYSFSKAHSASYAVESFQSLYLKVHFPQEFMVAVINNFGGFYRMPVYVNEARRCGAAVHLPCVNNSEYLTSIRGNAIYLGFVHVANLETAVARRIVDERNHNGHYSGLTNLMERTAIDHEQAIILIRLGALRFTGLTKKELLWMVHRQPGKKRDDGARPLFTVSTRRYSLPPLLQTSVEDAYDEFDLLGFPLSMSVFDLLQTSFRGEISATQMTGFVGKKVRMVGNLVIIKYVKTVKNEWMNFGCFLDVHGRFFDTVHFPQSLKLYPFRGYGVYLVLGLITEEFGFPVLEVEKMAKLPYKQRY